VYDGEWKDGLKNGRGKNTFPDGSVYDGEWKDDKQNGRGKHTFADGSQTWELVAVLYTPFQLQSLVILVAVLYTGWMHVFIFTLCGITKGNEMPSS
jgi:hypothetical protein